MTTKKGKKTVTVKAWAVYHQTLKDLSDKVFVSRKIAEEYLRENTYHSNPLIMKDILARYRIVPVVITYQL